MCPECALSMPSLTRSDNEASARGHAKSYVMSVRLAVLVHLTADTWAVVTATLDAGPRLLRLGRRQHLVRVVQDYGAGHLIVQRHALTTGQHENERHDWEDGQGYPA
jgi:hypothetical protein